MSELKLVVVGSRKCTKCKNMVPLYNTGYRPRLCDQCAAAPKFRKCMSCVTMIPQGEKKKYKCDDCCAAPKLCTYCNTLKKPDEFYKTAGGTLHTYCIPCRSTYYKRRNAKEPAVKTTKKKAVKPAMESLNSAVPAEAPIAASMAPAIAAY